MCVPSCAAEGAAFRSGLGGRAATPFDARAGWRLMLASSSRICARLWRAASARRDSVDSPPVLLPDPLREQSGSAEDAVASVLSYPAAAAARQGVRGYPEAGAVAPAPLPTMRHHCREVLER